MNALYASASAWSRSRIRSSRVSSPIDRRITSGRASGRQPLFVAELAMRGRGRVQHQAARVADVRQVREQLHILHQSDAGLVATLYTESEHRPGALGQVFARKLDR